MRQFFGPGHLWVVLARITPEGGDRKPVYVGGRTRLPDIPRTKVELELGGGFLLGEGRYQVGKVNAWEQPELATQYQISAVPTLLLFQDGKVVNKLVGYHDKPALLKALRQIEEPVPQ